MDIKEESKTAKLLKQYIEENYSDVSIYIRTTLTFRLEVYETLGFACYKLSKTAAEFKTAVNFITKLLK